MRSISDITIDILQDYLKASGREGMESGVSVEEYLLIRKCALQEMNSGMHRSQEAAATQQPKQPQQKPRTSPDMIAEPPKKQPVAAVSKAPAGLKAQITDIVQKKEGNSNSFFSMIASIPD